MSFGMPRWLSTKSKNRIMKNFLRVLAVIGSFIMLGAIPSIAKAACDPFTAQVTGPAVINIDPTLPVGTSLWSSSVTVGAATANACIGGQAVLTYTGVGAQENTYYTFPTGVAGVGVRIKYTAFTYCANVWFPCSTPLVNWSVGTVAQHTVFVEFIKTGPITVSGSTSGIFATWNASQSPTFNGVWGQYQWASPVFFNVSVPTCTVTTPNISVPMGSVGANSLASVGSVSASQPFNIALNCSGGVTNSYTNVYITLTDAINPANITDTLPLTPSSTASGVGIQVLNGTQTIHFGPDSSVAGNPNQWFAGSAANGAFNIPLTARYVRTGTMVPGTANGSATFTMSYQ
ncbi:fimbrial protein [Paraburkholderia dinghuensis]|uniref:Type 1 fimbrial protein n=1 Tax=Paraburkholderia dinghuensis TaxID=2305225 RepID=A0A3N6MHQ8_9BURK|nr:fimbrial protein [Paraburkholderia dinghuensis]RQH03599.1 type 1 fimbrial protein [Paraburkholderia dinghuensis]